VLAWQPSYSHPNLKRLGIGRAQAWLTLLFSSGLSNSGIGFVDLSKLNIGEEHYLYYLIMNLDYIVFSSIEESVL
jgi:hypothetical protein